MDYAEAGTKILCQNSDGFHLNWIHDRLTEVHGENKNVDYMRRLRKIIDKLGENAVGAANDKPEWKAGELPPVGTVCEFEIRENVWKKCRVIAIHNTHLWLLLHDENVFYTEADAFPTQFRPIQTDKERVIAKAISGTTVAYMCANIDTYRAWAADLYDRNMLSMPDKGES
ncbi:MAG: hypothetical protein JKY50_00655 [Oleispira sp.]|nr:hypothetical protein [Oleispira sp.]